MNGDGSSNTPATEAAAWLKYLNANGNVGEVYARKGTAVLIETGAFNLYEEEEKALIAKYRPPLCKR